MCVTDADCSGDMSCSNVANTLSVYALLEMMGAIDLHDTLPACGGVTGVITKIANQLAKLFQWSGPDGDGLPSSLNHVSVCMPSISQV